MSMLGGRRVRMRGLNHNVVTLEEERGVNEAELLPISQVPACNDGRVVSPGLLLISGRGVLTGNYGRFLDAVAVDIFPQSHI